MADNVNHKVLREYCDLSGCPLWAEIQKLEQAAKRGNPREKLSPADRSDLRRFCVDRCHAYLFSKWLTCGNYKIVRREGLDAYK